MIDVANMAILIPAAGASHRMRGSDKLMEPLHSDPILRHVTKLAVQTGAKVIVTLSSSGPYTFNRRSVICDLPVTILTIEDAMEGLAASVRAAAKFAHDADGLMVVLPDMPEINLDDLNTLLEEFALAPDLPLRASTIDGEVGHPVIFPRRLFAALCQLRGAFGAKHMLEQQECRLAPLAARRAVVDLDTPEEWERWRQAQTRQ